MAMVWVMATEAMATATWWTSKGDYGNGNGDKTCNGNGNEVVGNKEGDGNTCKSNDDGNDEGNVVRSKGD